LKEFIEKYNEKIGRGCNDIEDVINDIVEDSLEAIRSNLRELADDVDTGEYSNKEISDRLTEIIKKI
jgi:hypothetical protein